MRRIRGFHKDEEGYWVAELDCGHTRHMRHDPPWQERTWVLWTAFYDEYPGRSRLLTRAAELCGPGARFSVPSAAAWEEGLPMTRCHRKYP